MTIRPRSEENMVPATHQGIRKVVDIGVRISVPDDRCEGINTKVGHLVRQAAGVPVRIAGIERNGSETTWTLAVGLGTVEDVKTASGSSIDGLALVHQLVHQLAAYDAALGLLPDEDSVAARRARQLTRGVDEGVQELARAS